MSEQGGALSPVQKKVEKLLYYLHLVPLEYIFLLYLYLHTLHIKNGPPDAVYMYSDNDWITEEIFIELLTHLQKFVKAILDPLLLAIDNHSTLFNLDLKIVDNYFFLKSSIAANLSFAMFLHLIASCLLDCNCASTVDNFVCSSDM